MIHLVRNTYDLFSSQGWGQTQGLDVGYSPGGLRLFHHSTATEEANVWRGRLIMDHVFLRGLSLVVLFESFTALSCNFY